MSQSEHQMSKTPVSHFCILFFSKAHSWISDAFLMSLDTCKCQCQHTQRASEDRHFLSFGALWLLHGMSQRLDDSTNAPRISHATILKRNAIAARHEGGGRLGGHLVLLAKKSQRNGLETTLRMCVSIYSKSLAANSDQPGTGLKKHC